MKMVIFRLTFTPNLMQILTFYQHPTTLVTSAGTSPTALPSESRETAARKSCVQRYVELRERLVERGYRRKIIENDIDRVKVLRRKSNTRW